MTSLRANITAYIYDFPLDIRYKDTLMKYEFQKIYNEKHVFWQQFCWPLDTGMQMCIFGLNSFRLLLGWLLFCFRRMEAAILFGVPF